VGEAVRLVVDLTRTASVGPAEQSPANP
jgi:hypothetical protein